MSDQQISDHITYREATKSITAKRKGMDNTPGEEEIENMKFIARTIFEPIREDLGSKPLGIASFYRSPEVNVAVGGSNKSQHCDGESIDIDGDIVGLHTNKEIFDCIRLNYEFDQLIFEHGSEKEPDWVHVSKTSHGNREEVLRAFKDNAGQTSYKYYEP